MEAREVEGEGAPGAGGAVSLGGEENPLELDHKSPGRGRSEGSSD